jgi:hypothetical protein
MSVSMNKPEQSAPLTLLLGDSAFEVKSALQSFFETAKEFSVSQGDLRNGSNTEVVFKGVSLIVAVGPSNHDIALFKNIFCNLAPSLIHCSVDIRLGGHVAGGERVPSIIQALLEASRMMGSVLNAHAIMWHPAMVVSGFVYFSEVVADYVAGGAFPVLALVNFKAQADGVIASKGLDLLSGQELQVEDCGMDQREIMRRVVRVVHDVAVNGPIQQVVKLDGIEPGEIVQLEPLPECGLLRMKAYSISDA